MNHRRVGPLERLPQAIAEQVVRRIVELLDIDEIVQRVDVDGVVQRVDVNAVIDRVDINAVLDKVDVDRLAARIDVNAIADRIDIDELVKRADLGPIIAQSTTGMFGEFLGFVRRDVVALDDVLDTVTLFKRRNKDRPSEPVETPQPEGAVAPTREGHYAGGVTRLLSFLVDIGAIWGLYLLGSAGVEQAVRLITGHTYTVEAHRTLASITLAVWAFVYFAAQWFLSGRTIGMALFGARVITAQGHGGITRRQAVVRTLVLPFSIVLWFVALIEIVIRSDRRTMHDFAAGTCVVYHWQARGASLPWLQRSE